MPFYMLDNPNPYAIQGIYPRRGGNRPSGTMIMHTSESVLDIIGDDSTAEDCAAFISRRNSHGCYHDLVDSDSIIEMYPFEYETWGDTETNNWACHISAACRTSDWATMGEAKREGFYRNLAWCAADFVMYMREAYNIEVPRKRISGVQARNREPGFCAHGDSGLYRTDPGKDFDWDRFFRYTNEILDGVEMATPEQIAAAVWEHGDAYKKLSDVASGNIPMTNQYGTTLTIADQLSWIDKNLNDYAKALLNERVSIAISTEDITALANTLKESLSAELAADLAKRLAE